MTENDKIRFIRELINNVQADILSKVPRMPEEWDGHELRRFIADRFSDAAMTVGAKGPQGVFYRKRTRAYRNEVLIRNL